MQKGTTKGERGLTCPVMTRITRAKYEEYQLLACKSKCESVSSIIRKMIYDKPVKVFVHDESMDLLMEELAAVRGEIKAIGININQMAKLFNTYTEPQIKAFYAKIGYKEYLRVESKVDEVLSLISKLAKKWLRE